MQFQHQQVLDRKCNTIALIVLMKQQGVKYPLADYELTPDMAIVDAELMMSMPKGLTAASGIDVLVHAVEA